MKKYLWMLSVFFLIISVITISKTYGLFETNAIASPEIKVAKWQINVDNKDITESKEITLSNFIYEDKVGIEDGYFAPGSKAVYPIEIDASNSDVAISYSITINTDSVKDHPNIIFSVTENGVDISHSGNVYSGVITLEELNSPKLLNISIEWINNEEYNESDTKVIGTELPIKLEAKFSQYIGE